MFVTNANFKLYKFLYSQLQMYLDWSYLLNTIVFIVTLMLIILYSEWQISANMHDNIRGQI